MAGLINSAMGATQDDAMGAGGAPAGAMPPGQMPQDQGGAPDLSQDQGGASDPSQEQGSKDGKTDAGAVKMVIIMAMKALYNDGNIQHALDMIQSAPSPAKGLADATWDLMQHLDDKTGSKIPLQALAPAASEVLGLIADSAAKKGLPVHGKEIAIATQAMVLRLMTIAGMDTSQMQASVSKVNYDQVGAMIDQQLSQKER